MTKILPLYHFSIHTQQFILLMGSVCSFEMLEHLKTIQNKNFKEEHHLMDNHCENVNTYSSTVVCCCTILL